MRDIRIIVVGNLPCKNEMRSRIYTSDGISPTILSMSGERGYIPPPIMINNETNMATKQTNFNLPPELQGKKFRIRKLTPRECFRLMGVDDPDIDKIQAAGISNSAQYKLAGNSIVVDVLYHIFRKAFIQPEADLQQGSQLSLF